MQTTQTMITVVRKLKPYAMPCTDMKVTIEILKVVTHILEKSLIGGQIREIEDLV